MAEQEPREDRPARLRRLAEKRSGERATQSAEAVAGQDVQGLIHELQVHQIELEMQNEELRTAQEQLGEALAKYSDLYDFAPVGYVTLDSKGHILEANLTFAGQLGIERSRMINALFWLYTAAPERDRFQSHLNRIFASRERQTLELKLQQLNGQQRYVQLDSIWVLNVDGVEVCRTSVTDVSTRKEIEEELIRVQNDLERRVLERTAELSENENRYRRLSQEFYALLSAISDTLILVSSEREILWTNLEYAQQPLEAQIKVVRQHSHEFLHSLSALADDSPVTRCFSTGKREVSMVTRDGVVLDMRAFPIHDGERVGKVLLLVSDITEKMAMQAEAMQAAHMASLGELAAGVAHEINNPITGIINYGQILINECSSESLEKDIGERIVKEGERVGRIVRTLLLYARNGQEERKPNRVPDILSESIVLTQAQIRKEGISLKTDLPDDLPEVDVNFQQIQQGFVNIINNARYALNEKYPGRHENKLLEITGVKLIIDDRPYVRIVFHDHGVGISPHELSILTKPFFSTKPIGKGTGLGLNITEKIIAAHGGHLSFESAKGEFTRVMIDLPVKG
jgi:two-component system, NtrC family, sensor kinase